MDIFETKIKLYPQNLCRMLNMAAMLTHFTARSGNIGLYVGKSENNGYFGIYCSLRPEKL